ncbi:hypothetical protein ACIP9H_33620 [Streptomyces sp. NPDC088732]|uniref:hypothetical protein n=1 Tax=Streptomyces sp. NPDC088732 TaxID=3365879 RepID=UPI00382BDC2C
MSNSGTQTEGTPSAMPRILAPLRQRAFRRPTGLPNPPMILLTGPEKSGKSYEAALGTGSDLIGMGYWIEIGGSEGTADYYGRVPGAHYEIVPHDGSYQDILDAIRAAVAQPPVNGKPNMIVLDGMSNLWDMLSDEQALYARRRAIRKAQENKRRPPSLDDVVIVDADLWNRAKDRWGEVLWLLRQHAGPVVLLARQEIVTAFENDKPTREKTRKVKAERNLPAAVDAIVELHTLGEAWLTGVRTLHWNVKPGETTRFEGFSIDALLRRLGFTEAVATRASHELRPDAYLEEPETTVEPPRPEVTQHARQEPQQTQRPRQEPSVDEEKPPTGEEAAEFIRRALTDPLDPEKVLLSYREEWGSRTLARVITRTAWGEMSADALITRSLKYIKGKAAAKTGTWDGAGQKEAPTTGSTLPPPGAEEDGHEHPEDDGQRQEHAEPEPPDESTTPPPPDPEGEPEPPAGEEPADVSEAEEPQDLPPAPPPAARRRRNRAETLAVEALMVEANVQARVLFLTVGEHLGPISEHGEPGMSTLRDHLLAHRPEVIKTLEEAEEKALATYYRSAPIPDLSFAKRFAAFLDDAPPTSVTR